MKKYLIFGALLLNALSLKAQHHLSGCPKGQEHNLFDGCWDYPYILVFQDEFDGPDLDLDQTKWTGRWNQGSTGDVQEYNMLGNVTVLNGKATVTAKSETIWGLADPAFDAAHIMGDGEPNYRQFNFTSANVWSKYIFEHGYYEIMCKVPSVSGYWPAFWLYNEVGGVNNELDIFEMMNNNAHEASLTIHNGDQCGRVHDDGTDYSDGMHKFAALWDDWMIIWYIDDIPVQYTYKWYHPLMPFGISCQNNEEYGPLVGRINGTFPNAPMSIIFNLAVRDGVPTSTPQQTMEIEYIRFYQARMNCYTDKTYTTASSLSLDDDPIELGNHPYYNHETGRNIYLYGDNIIVENDKQLKLTAAVEITKNIDPATGLLNPAKNWEVQVGANYEEVIDPNVCSNFVHLPTRDVINKAPDQIVEGLANQNENGTLDPARNLFGSQKVSISPNPTNQDVVTIVSSERTKVIITNSLGRKVKEIEVQSGLNKLNVQDLSSGVYQLYFESLKETIKLVRL
jgi:beta-glucanase (GH16 family)